MSPAPRALPPALPRALPRALETLAARRDEGDAQVITQPKTSTAVQRPPRYSVVLLNDDYTTKDFVVLVLMTYFHKTLDEAFALTDRVHREGRGVAGVYPHDVAETKQRMTLRAAELYEMPLRVVLEPER
ncbi:MAG: ATP-dependent Clp protease adaptor ClpS [Deltaproteobacteria bacterium]|nr:ATP-dependent Clp protease adaptor ClpS [Deltaproteobacteria bacterium]